MIASIRAHSQERDNARRASPFACSTFNRLHALNSAFRKVQILLASRCTHAPERSFVFNQFNAAEPKPVQPLCRREVCIPS